MPASRASTPRAPARRPACSPSTPRQTPKARSRPCRACGWCPAPISRSAPTRRSRRTSSATSATAVAVVVAETRYQAQDALDLIDVDYEPLPAVVDPAARRRGGRAATASGHRGQPGLSLDGGGRRRRCGVRGGRRGRGQGADRPAAAHSDRDGAAVGGRAVGARDRRADAVEHHPEPAHRPVRLLGRDRRARRQAARDCAGSRRRIRQQDRAVSG